jgi:hypothetical protein
MPYRQVIAGRSRKTTVSAADPHYVRPRGSVQLDLGEPGQWMSGQDDAFTAAVTSISNVAPGRKRRLTSTVVLGGGLVGNSLRRTAA